LICARDKSAFLKFHNSGDTDGELKTKLQGLFDSAKARWEGIFTEDSKILLTLSHLAVCVSHLQNVKLFNNNLNVIDDAFEYLMSKSQKGEKGQYLTPRYVIDMCVKMMNPKAND
jgi:type I restriction enzyme M protein